MSLHYHVFVQLFFVYFYFILIYSCKDYFNKQDYCEVEHNEFQDSADDDSRVFFNAVHIGAVLQLGMHKFNDGDPLPNDRSVRQLHGS